jgi:hypothetical protein
MHMFVVLLVVFQLYAAATLLADDAVRTAFDQAYRDWNQHVESHMTPEGRLSSKLDLPLLYDNEPWRKLIAMGPPIVPFIVERFEKHQSRAGFGRALPEIVKWRYHIDRTGDRPREYVFTVREFPQISASRGGHIDELALWKMWLTEGHKEVPQRFQGAYDRWRELDTAIEKLPADAPGRAQMVKQRDEACQQMSDLGIHVLPNLVEKIGEGEHKLIPILAQLTNGEGTPKGDATVDKSQYVRQWWQQHKEFWTVPSLNSSAP